MEKSFPSVDLGRCRRIVQMFWDPEPMNDATANQPVWCLGLSYRLGDGKSSSLVKETLNENRRADADGPAQSHTEAEMEQKTRLALNTQDEPLEPEPNSLPSSSLYDKPRQDGDWPQGFLEDFESKFWMTYRSNFELIQRSGDPKANTSLSLAMKIKTQLSDQSGFSSDSGWGCMIRSGQSLLANTITLLRLGREWRRGSSPRDEREIIRLFADDPRAPYSIHQFVRHGEISCGKYPGEWFGPSATAQCIQSLVNSHDQHLRVYSTGDGPDVYEDSFMKIAKPDGEHFHPTLILVGTRLGIDKITPVYWEALIASLQMSQSVGIAGGRPSSAHYFAGAQGSLLFYLDPHHTRTALPYHSDLGQYTKEEVGSCHTNRLRCIHVREMDPSMLIAFLIRSEADWKDWKRCVKHVQGKAIIHVADHDPVLLGKAEGRAGAIDEVETLSDDDASEAV